MGVNTISNICGSVAKDALDTQLVGTFVIKLCSTCVTALMWLMLTPSRFTYSVEQL